MVAEVDSGSRAAGATTVNQLPDLWLKQCDAVGRPPTTVRKYHEIADRTVRPELGTIRLTRLSSRDLDRLYAKLTAKGNAPATVRRVHASIGAALHQAERWELVDRNVARRAQPPEVRTKRIVAPWLDEVKQLLAVAEDVDPTLGVMLTLAATTGARRGELCALRWSDLDWGLATLTIGRSVYETAGGGRAEKDTKTHQERTIGLDEFTIAVLSAHRARVDALATELDLALAPNGFLLSRSPVGAEPVLPSVLTHFTSKVSKRTSGPLSPIRITRRDGRTGRRHPRTARIWVSKASRPPGACSRAMIPSMTGRSSTSRAERSIRSVLMGRDPGKEGVGQPVTILPDRGACGPIQPATPPVADSGR
jgi:integrase